MYIIEGGVITILMNAICHQRQCDIFRITVLSNYVFRLFLTVIRSFIYLDGRDINIINTQEKCLSI